MLLNLILAMGEIPTGRQILLDGPERPRDGGPVGVDGRQPLHREPGVRGPVVITSHHLG